MRQFFVMRKAVILSIALCAALLPFVSLEKAEFFPKRDITQNSHEATIKEIRIGLSFLHRNYDAIKEHHDSRGYILERFYHYGISKEYVMAPRSVI
jgi:hypothetical protein